MKIRCADHRDIGGLRSLLNHYIVNSLSTFDAVPLDRAAIERWVATLATPGPHHLFVAKEGRQTLGFCSSRPYGGHPAFASTVETSVYVTPGVVSRGIGSALYHELFQALATHGLHRAVVEIALPNEASVALHSKFQFKRVGVFDEYAKKNGRFLSSLWMERPLDAS